ncbi:MAG TPA: hypothetical protein VMF62_20135 [Acetobacteraceae bacterium]|nr:hypothetical protein [Acetobacteraceae bacterium]
MMPTPAEPRAGRLRLGVHPDRPERLCVMTTDGTPKCWFAYDETLEEVKAKLACAGIEFTVDEDVR